MKKIFTLSLLTIASLGFAQSFKFTLEGKDVTGTQLTIKIVKGELKETILGLKNISNKDKYYKVTRTLKTPFKLAACNRIDICTGFLCYPTNHEVIDTLPDDFLFKANSVLPIPGDSTSFYGMSLHFNVCEDNCEDHVVLYTIWDEANPADFSELTVNYTCTNGIKEYDLGTISPAYPNPTNGLITIDYTLKNTPKNAKIVFYDMLGKMVKETAITNQQGVAKINITDLHTGFYFYNFMVDGKTSNARKLIISGN